MKVVNDAVLRGLREELSDEVVGDLLAQLADHLAAESEPMRACASARNWAGLAELSHRVAGTAGSLGCTALADALSVIEAGLRSDPKRHPTATEMEATIRLAEHTVVALKEVIGGLRAQRGGGGGHC